MKILQLAYYYPPMGGAGVQRALKFSKYLPEFDIHPVVVAAHDPAYVGDSSLVDDIPGSVQVHRISHQPWLQRVLAWRKARMKAGQPAGAASLEAATEPAGMGAASHRRLRDALLSAYAMLQYPDDKGMWARRAMHQARAVLREQPVDLIFSSSPPMSVHWMASRLAAEFRLPWVADFRDLWADGPGYAAPQWRRAIDRRLQAHWLSKAQGVVTVTPSLRDLLARQLGPDCPVAFIPNGYDEKDFAGLDSPARDASVFRLTYTGTFYGSQDPSTLLEGLALYLERTGADAPSLRLRLIGNVGGRFEAMLAAFQVRFPGVIERRAYLPHRQALAEMMAADALLLLVGTPRNGLAVEAVAGVLPAKLFEYLRAGRPILLLGDETGDSARLLREQGQHRFADVQKPQQIAQALAAMVGDARSAPAGAASGPSASVTRFERRELSHQLAQFLTSCSAGDHGRLR
nr:glycosyltransferase [uncultured Roseateles sp.]